MKKCKIIANPVAGNGSGERALPRIQEHLTKYGMTYDIVRTEYPLHATELAKQAVVDGYPLIVAAGGDGTSNEVINGLMEAKKSGPQDIVLGLLSTGRGNDFAHAVQVPSDLDRACRVLVEGQRRSIDIGRVYGGQHPEGRYFGNCVGVGFDAIGTIEASKLPKWGGFLSFLVAVLKTIFLYYKGPLITLEYDDQTVTLPSLMVSIMNGRRLGGGFWMAPEAEPDDGLFDICIARQVSRARIFTLIPHFLRGTQASQKEITTGKVAWISITAVEGSLPAQTDGEIICVDGKHLEVELMPRQLDVLCTPPGEQG